MNKKVKSEERLENAKQRKINITVIFFYLFVFATFILGVRKPTMVLCATAQFSMTTVCFACKYD